MAGKLVHVEERARWKGKAATSPDREMIPEPNILTVGKCPATLRDQGSVRTDRADRRTNRFSANENAVTSRDHTPRCFASFRVAAKRLVVDALFNLERTDRFGGVGGFVNISRHRRNILVNGLGAFLFGNVCAIRRFTSPKV